MRRFRTATPPYQSGIVLPSDVQTMPFAQMRSHAWPREGAFPQVACAADRVSPDTFFLPREATQSFYGAPTGAVSAVVAAARHLAGMQRNVLQKHLNREALTPTEVRELLRMQLPQTVSGPVMSRARARAAGVPTYAARQIPFYARSGPPPELMAAAVRLRRR